MRVQKVKIQEGGELKIYQNASKLFCFSKNLKQIKGNNTGAISAASSMVIVKR